MQKLNMLKVSILSTFTVGHFSSRALGFNHTSFLTAVLWNLKRVLLRLYEKKKVDCHHSTKQQVGCLNCVTACSFVLSLMLFIQRNNTSIFTLPFSSLSHKDNYFHAMKQGNILHRKCAILLKVLCFIWLGREWVMQSFTDCLATLPS